MISKTEDDEFRASGLTSRIYQGVRTTDEFAPGVPLKIVKKSQFSESLFLKISSDAMNTSPLKLRLAWLVRFDGKAYAVVTHTGRDYDENPFPPVMVLKVLDENTLQTIDENEFDQIAHDSLRIVHTAPPAVQRDVAGCLGEFALTEV